jgi:hypothetical protein
VVREAIAAHGIDARSKRTVTTKIVKAAFNDSRQGMSRASNNTAWSRGLKRLIERGVVGYDDFAGMLWLTPGGAP